MALSLFDHITVKVASALIEGSYVVTDFLDGTTAKVAREREAAEKSNIVSIKEGNVKDNKSS